MVYSARFMDLNYDTWTVDTPLQPVIPVRYGPHERLPHFTIDRLLSPQIVCFQTIGTVESSFISKNNASQNSGRNQNIDICLGKNGDVESNIDHCGCAPKDCNKKRYEELCYM